MKLSGAIGLRSNFGTLAMSALGQKQTCAIADIAQRTKTARSSDNVTPRAKARVYIAEEVAMAQKLDIAFWS
jgi:hypothetical protein